MHNYEAVDILLVEDNPSDAEMTLRALKQKNVANRVVWVKDGEEALQFIFCRAPYEGRIGRLPPKLILLDLKMPKMDGLEVLAKLKEDVAASLIPVVMLTSSKEERDILDSYRLHANSYIVKPVDFAQFSEAVGAVGLYWLVTNQPPLFGKG